MTPAAQILAEALARPATLGTGRLICLEGPSGSGKSTVAVEMGRLTEVVVIHTDDLCPGWDGVPELPAILLGLLEPLTRSETGRAPRYDWILGHLVEDVELPPVPLVVLEGVGSGARVLAPFTTTLAWIDADPAVRRTRALARDGEYFVEMWEPWAASEASFHATEDVEARADLRFDTTS